MRPDDQVDDDQAEEADLEGFGALLWPIAFLGVAIVAGVVIVLCSSSSSAPAAAGPAGPGGVAP